MGLQRLFGILNVILVHFQSFTVFIITPLQNYSKGCNFQGFLFYFMYFFLLKKGHRIVRSLVMVMLYYTFCIQPSSPC